MFFGLTRRETKRNATRVAAPSPRASLGRRTVCGRTEQRRTVCGRTEQRRPRGAERYDTKVRPVWASFVFVRGSPWACLGLHGGGCRSRTAHGCPWPF